MSSFVLVGKPNCGKTLLFNRLTGLAQKVANFPGVTVEVKSGWRGEDQISDYPGIYSLNPHTVDETVAVEKLQETLARGDLTGIMCVVDGTRLERSLILAGQIQRLAHAHKKPLVLVVNMMDELSFNNTGVDLKAIGEALGTTYVGTSARTGEGLDRLTQILDDMAGNPEPYIPQPLTEDESQLRVQMRQLAREHGPQTDLLLRRQNVLDRIFLSNFLGGAAFFFIMAFIFQSIFTWAAPLMDLVEAGISGLGAVVVSFLPAGVLADFVNDALFGGFGSFLVFVPQIFVMMLLVGFLEDSGYLARAAVICHRPLSYFGLSGKSFVPLLSGHACAIPAMMAARTIDSPKQRLLTLFTIPLMACSARLPVYSLLVAALVPPVTYLGGLVGLQGFMFFGLYAFGIATALIVSAVLSKTTFKSASEAPFIIELPPYRLPNWKPLVKRGVHSSWAFITKAGAVIFWVVVAVWVLGYFPQMGGNLDQSYLAMMGRAIEPIFAPLGLDWRYGVAILASFLAREVFVGTLGTMFGIEGADERIADVAASIQAEGLTVASAAALLVFYAIALQCVSTLAIMKKETGGYKLPLASLALYTVLAYSLALLTYQIFA